MKKLMTFLAFILIVSTPFWGYASHIGVVIDGKSVEFTNEYGYPFVDSANRTQVPLRATMEAFGCTVEWDDINFCARVTKDDTTVIVPVGENYILKNGKKIINDTSSCVIDGRIYLPVRVVLEAFGSYVSWDNELNSVSADTSSKLLQVHFIDVGQGDCSLIDYGTYEILIDGGDNNKGKIVCDYIYPYIDGNIEIIVATHPDSDHIGGLDVVLSSYTVDKVIDSGYVHNTKTYKDYMDAVISEGCIFEHDTDAVIDMGDGAFLNIIETGDSWSTSNDMSVVCTLSYGSTNVLFTGDISENVEMRVLGKLSDTDVLKVAHHGSKTSSSAVFLDCVKPEYAVVSAGLGNRYGHPAGETMQRLDLCGTKVLGTYKSGTVILNINKEKFEFNKSDFILK